MTYTITILRRALKELSDLPQNSYTRVRDEIRKLAENPRPNGSKKLASRSGWRIRVGSYRVVYEINDASRLITIMHVGHRRDIYR
ncbi:type II toxin-antitoxin system RelE family toxin [Candidatus Manganitrophus noduliformans]|uniref:Type II toxin-antitoxin system RelE/ParE family toxin n=1 Tax=Candidatus Manganitrophus noduliformans TaxID=2606439 RepID=A0A7X6I9K9_9BACT|nr:type II toxin-antitoxin system RelE/ParE family toxin [Candidatus Manganitrophus noduliformans]